MLHVQGFVHVIRAFIPPQAYQCGMGSEHDLGDIRFTSYAEEINNICAALYKE